MTHAIRPLRIVHTEASVGWGGQELRILTEAVGLLRRGHEVQLLCPPETPILAEARRRGLPATALPIGRRTLKAVRSLRSWLKAHRPDVLNTHSSTDSWLAAAASRLLGRRLPVVRTRHISAPVNGDPLSRWLYARGADKVVTTGQRLRTTLVDHLRLPETHVVSIPTGVDTTRYRPGDRAAVRQQLNLPAAATIVGIAATIRTWKGHQYLVDAVRRLNRSEVLLLIVGDGPIRDVVERHVAEAGLEARIRFAGQQQDVVPWLQAMDIFALPSYANEGVPQAIVQAMSCQLPVVSTPVGAIDEAVVNEETGLLVPPKQVEPLAEALLRLITDGPLRHRLGTAGRSRAVAQFGIEQMLDAMEGVFAEAAGASQLQRRAAA
jgi:glycosyltransferase involved in cell wall biosynthesis